MSLLTEAFETFVLMNKTTVDDGYDGWRTDWTEGASFKGAVVEDDAGVAVIAQAIRSKKAYTLTVSRRYEFDLHDVIKRKSDGKIFRITNDSDEKKTPPSAGLDMKQYSAEEWAL